MGEFGAVFVVSGHIRGLTDTVPLHVETLYQEADPAAPFAVASLLALLALVTLVLKTWMEWRTERHHDAAQRASEMPIVTESSLDTERFARSRA